MVPKRRLRFFALGAGALILCITVSKAQPCRRGGAVPSPPRTSVGFTTPERDGRRSEGGATTRCTPTAAVRPTERDLSTWGDVYVYAYVYAYVYVTPTERDLGTWGGVWVSE